MTADVSDHRRSLDTTVLFGFETQIGLLAMDEMSFDRSTLLHTYAPNRHAVFLGSHESLVETELIQRVHKSPE